MSDYEVKGNNGQKYHNKQVANLGLSRFNLGGLVAELIFTITPVRE